MRRNKFQPVEHDQPIAVSELEYAALMKALCGIIFGRQDEAGQFWVKVCGHKREQKRVERYLNSI